MPQLGDPDLMNWIAAGDPLLLVIDPFQAFLPDSVNLNNRQQIRNLLQLLRMQAQQHGFAILLVTHTNKNPGSCGRKRLNGSGERPRLVIYRSLNHVYVQVIDDSQGNTLVAASSLDPSMKGQKMSLKEKATKVGELIGKRSTEKGITSVVFDRGGYKYHGRVAALAEAARGAGLEF